MKKEREEILYEEVLKTPNKNILSNKEAFKLFDESNSYHFRAVRALERGEKILPFEKLDYILKHTTLYQRLLWLKKAFNFWKRFQTKKMNLPEKNAKAA